jgi:hypothetical protein
MGAEGEGREGVIQKIITGRGFRGVLDYVLKESAELKHEEARIVGSNIKGTTARELAREFGKARRLNPDLTRQSTTAP